MLFFLAMKNIGKDKEKKKSKIKDEALRAIKFFKQHSSSIEICRP